MFGRRSKRHKVQQPPEGFGEKDIRVEKSICTGEATIGFWDSRTGRLLQAVAVNSPQEITDYYRAYGFTPPGE